MRLNRCAPVLLEKIEAGETEDQLSRPIARGFRNTFGGKADIGWMRRNVCFRPKADINTVGQTVRVSPRAAQPTPVDLESQGWL